MTKLEKLKEKYGIFSTEIITYRIEELGVEGVGFTTEDAMTSLIRDAKEELTTILNMKEEAPISYKNNIQKLQELIEDAAPDFAPIKGWSSPDGKLFTLEIEA